MFVMIILTILASHYDIQISRSGNYHSPCVDDNKQHSDVPEEWHKNS